jgi:tetratricopeptide (TPR) repeat protein
MLTGQVPYDAETSIAIAIKHIQEPVPELPPEFAKYRRVLNGLLAKNPEERFQDAATFIRAVNGVEYSDESPTQILSSQPTEILTIPTLGEAEHSGKRDRKIKLSGRKPLLWAMRGVMMVLALICLLFLANGWYEKTKAPAIDGRNDGPISLTPEKNPLDSTDKVSANVGNHADAPVLVSAGDTDGADQGTPPGKTGQTTAKIPRQELLQRIGDLLDRQEFVAAQQEMADAAAAYAGDKDFEHLAKFYNQLATIFDILKTDTAPITGYSGPVMALLADIKQAEPEYGLSRRTMVMIEQRYVKEAQALADRQQIAEASRTCEDGLAVFPDNQPLQQLRNRLQKEQLQTAEKRQIASLLEKAAGYFQNRQLTTPVNSNALDTYREILRLEPGNQDATTGIAKIANQYRQWSETQQKAGDYDTALNYIEAALKVTPANTDLLALQIKLQAQAAEHGAEQQKEQKIADLLASANKQLSKTDFDPLQKDHPSVAPYRQVLQLEPNNQDALAGLKSIARLYALLASKAYNDGAKEQARSLLKKGTAIAPQEAAAKAHMLDLLSKAGSELEGNSAGQWAAAAALYRQVLAMEPDNQKAVGGLSDVAQRYSDQAMALESNDKLTEALTLLQGAQDILPDEKTILEARTRIEKAIAWQKAKRIEKIFTSYKGTQNEALGRNSFPVSRDRIFVCFEFRNFAPGTILTLVWSDYSRKTNIREIPVIMTNKNGWQTVALEHPLEGFVKGNYHIDLIDSEGAIMGTTEFKIKE